MAIQKRKTEEYVNLGGINRKASSYATGPQEFLDLRNFDFSVPGALTKRWGSTQYVGATVAGTVGGLYEYEKLSGFSQLIFTANTNAFSLVGGTPVSFRSGLTNNGIFDFLTFVDRLFMTNGSEFFKYDGTAATNYSLPPGVGMTFAIGVSTAAGISGLITFYYGYKNDRGYYGPATQGVTITALSFTNISFSGFTTPAGYGISALIFYASENNQTQGFQAFEFPVNTATLVVVQASLAILGSRLASDALWFTAAPTSIEIYNNQLFLAGFSGAQSTVYFSDIGEPESVLPESFFEVRTNDGDKMTNLKSYYTQLLLFKERSFHALSGDDPSNFTLRQISDQYGAISKRAVATFEDKCFFLDRKGIVEFNGANVAIVSDRIEHIFNRMNLSAAATFAIMQHVGRRNEVWTAIPCDGATFNNCIIVYDYQVQAFTVFDGLSPSALTVSRATFSQYFPFFGDYSGRVHNFGESLYSDNGVGMTALFQTRNYNGEMGFSVQKLWRRLFLDTNQQASSTQTINIDFYVNDGTSMALTRSMGETLFQSRIDFGLSAKSLSFVLSNVSNDSPLKINGFTIEYRFQRAV